MIHRGLRVASGMAAVMLLAGSAWGADVHLAGDSILCDYAPNYAPQQGWGQPLSAWAMEGVKVHNHAKGGHALKTFRADGHWDKLLEGLKEGDYVVLAFGHNDANKSRPERYANHRGEFGELLKAHIAEVRARGAHPILTTPTPRWAFTDDRTGLYNGTAYAYSDAVRATGKETDTPVVDLNGIGARELIAQGPDATRAFYMVATGKNDNLHLTKVGAAAYARWFVEALGEQASPMAALFAVPPPGSEPLPEAADATPAPAAKTGPRLWLVGDSTMSRYHAPQAPQQGWGHALSALVRDGVAVENHAIGGRSAKSFREEGRWERLLGQVSEGDFVLIQFGHNDANQRRPERFSNAWEEFPQRLTAFAEDIRAKQATPVLVTTTVGWLYRENDTQINNGTIRYVEAMRKVGETSGIAVIDLNAAAIKHMLDLGPEKTKPYYMISVDGKDYLHLTDEGAKAYAAWFVEAVKAEPSSLAALFQ